MEGTARWLGDEVRRRISLSRRRFSYFTTPHACGPANVSDPTHRQRIYCIVNKETSPAVFASFPSIMSALVQAGRKCLWLLRLVGSQGQWLVAAGSAFVLLRMLTPHRSPSRPRSAPQPRTTAARPPASLLELCQGDGSALLHVGIVALQKRLDEVDGTLVAQIAQGADGGHHDELVLALFAAALDEPRQHVKRPRVAQLAQPRDDRELHHPVGRAVEQLQQQVEALGEFERAQCVGDGGAHRGV
mmetsp:Transcript_27474/g.68994  ORF Transcript_27474/g.68994 Transcript_27474/m.68994 type:complete len:245 (-) Transcript_27474:80-814(-)